jgi:RND family efflux transporter MFP subunit
MMRDASWRLWGLGMAAAVLLVACKTETPEPQKVLRPVRYQAVELTAGERVRAFAGKAKSGEETRLSFKVKGTIRQLLVKVGDTVKQGQMMAEIDAKDYILQQQEADASLARARAEARRAAANYSRTRALYENNNASREELDTARANHESAKAQVRSAAKQLELSRLQVSYTKLQAAADGAIAAVPVEVNENVNAGQLIALLNSGGQPEVDVAIPEVFIARIRQGAAVTVAFDALPGQVFSAQVTEVGIASTGTATTFPVTVQLDAPDPAMRSGMAASVSFTFSSGDASTPGDEQQRMVVPLHAVGEDRQGRFVFVVEPQGDGRGVVRRRPVSVGALDAEGLRILEGLKEGELLVTAGVKRLEDGREVKVQTDKGR